MSLWNIKEVSWASTRSNGKRNWTAKGEGGSRAWSSGQKRRRLQTRRNRQTWGTIMGWMVTMFPSVQLIIFLASTPDSQSLLRRSQI